MPPKFSLQPVLNFRHSRVEALEIELGRLQSARGRELARLRAMEDARARLLHELREQQAGRLDLVSIGQSRLGLKVVEGQMTQQVTLLDDLARQIEARRLELVAAKVDEETLELLKAKELERHRAEQARQEDRLRDDIYIAQAFRRAAS